jgi:Ser/Thr protein kinase RdoA (MazF antagonist)
VSGEVPAPVLTAYGWDSFAAEPTGTGLINDTFLVRDGDRPVAIVQRLHPVFGPEVNLDLEAVTEHLTKKGLATPLLIRTKSGAPYVDEGDRSWRAITYVVGRCYDRVEDPRQAESAGVLVGRFHRALADFEHDYVFTRTGVHDTPAHLEKLRTLAAEHGGDDEGRALADAVLEAADALPSWPQLPRRHTHGDLKISNIIFEDTGLHAQCLIDLDTCGLQLIPYELGDAMRSWCNPRGEDVSEPSIDLGILEAAMRGYAQGAAGLLESAEIEAIVPGLQTVCIELAARFAADVFEDTYFGWDSERFPSRRAHNLVRARGQLALGRSALAAGDAAQEQVRAAFGL